MELILENGAYSEGGDWVGVEEGVALPEVMASAFETVTEESAPASVVGVVEVTDEEGWSTAREVDVEDTDDTAEVEVVVVEVVL